MLSPKSLLLSALIFLAACTTSDESTVEIIKIDGLQKLLKEKDHKLHVVNFWATWCNTILILKCRIRLVLFHTLIVKIIYHNQLC